jgi:hypothetical protein
MRGLPRLIMATAAATARRHKLRTGRRTARLKPAARGSDRRSVVAAPEPRLPKRPATSLRPCLKTMTRTGLLYWPSSKSVMTFRIPYALRRSRAADKQRTGSIER